MRIVVTGSEGRVGRAIAAELAREHDVVRLDRVQGASRVHYVGDVGDRALLATAFAGAHAVAHVAALHAPHVGVVSDAEIERVNVEATRAVISAARAAGVRRIVFTSTTALYGMASQTSGRATWIDEAVEPRPLTICHRTKLAAERLLREAADDSLQVRILRMSRCFPEAADVTGVYRLHRGIDARDVATAHAAALVHEGDPHHTWVISGAPPFEASDLQALGEDAAAVLRVRAPGLAAAYDARGWLLPASIDRVYVPARAMRELAWRPRHGFEAVLAMLDQGSAEVLAPLRVRR